MFLELRGLLNPSEIARLVVLAQELKFVEGRLSNPANTTKDNLQADHADPKYAEIARKLPTNSTVKSTDISGAPVVASPST